MAYTIRGRRVGYDNIASGSAAGKEQTAVGTSGVVSGVSQKYGGGSGQAKDTTLPTSTDSFDNIITVSGDLTSVWPLETMKSSNA